jgi:integrase
MARRGQNEGTIFLRRDGRWVALLNQGWRNGKRVRKSFYGQTRKEVQEELTKALSDIQKGLPVVTKEQTVSDYLDWWLPEVAQRTTRPSTYASYSQIVRLYLRRKAPAEWQPDAAARAAYERRKKAGKLKPDEAEPTARTQRSAIGHVKLSRLTAQDVRSLLNEMHDFGLSARTVQYTHAILRSALEVALRHDMVTRNVAALVQPPRAMAKEVQPLTPDETRRFLKAIAGDRLHALFTVAVALGLRQGEALALRWRDLDLDDRSLNS